MPTIWSIAATAMLAICLCLILVPFFPGQMEIKRKGKGKLLQPQLDEERKQWLAALNELEFDYRMNKVSLEDYQKLSKTYQTMIAMQMKKETEVKWGGSDDRDS